MEYNAYAFAGRRMELFKTYYTNNKRMIRFGHVGWGPNLGKLFRKQGLFPLLCKENTSDVPKGLLRVQT